MAQLLLNDGATGTAIGQRVLLPDERAAIYHMCFEHEPFAFEGKFYRIHSVAWRKADNSCVCVVTAAPNLLRCGCHVGDCVCD